MARLGWFGMGDVVADAMTWVTYGNNILSRAESEPTTIGAEALKASQNINTFLANRGDELDATSPGTVTKLDDMVDKLAYLAKTGLIRADDSFGTAFSSEVDDFNSEAARLAKAGAKPFVDAGSAVYQWMKKEGGDAIDKATTPLVIVVAGILGVAYIMYGNKK